MKNKLLTIVLALTMVLALSACHKTERKGVQNR